MPPYQPRPLTAGRQLIILAALAAIVAGAAFVCIAFPPFLLAIPCLILLGAMIQRMVRKLLRALAASRPGESICSFARAFDYRNTDTWIIRAVYEELQEHLNSECADFPIRPDDRLLEDLRIDPEDLDDLLARQIAERTGRSLANPEANPYYGKVKTVRDLVTFFAGQQVLSGPPIRA